MIQRVKIVVTVPEDAATNLRQAVGDADGSQIGNYSHCSFTVKGVGRFLPKDGAHPAIGKVGKLEEVTEDRIEFTCEKQKLKSVIKAIRDNHPYEEPVIDIYPMLSEN